MIIENKELILLHTKALKNKLKEFNYSKEEIDNVKTSLSFLIDDKFIIGCKLINDKNINKYYLVYSAENKKDNKTKIYPRTKIKICKEWIERLSKRYPVISVVNIYDKMAIKFNNKLFKYQILLDRNEYLKDKYIYSSEYNFLMELLEKNKE